jgi:hypothetical protein
MAACYQIWPSGSPLAQRRTFRRSERDRQLTLGHRRLGIVAERLAPDDVLLPTELVAHLTMGRSGSIS